MARVRYLGPEPVTVPELGPERTVHPDELVEVPDERFDGYVCQTVWEPVEEPPGWQPPAPVKPEEATAMEKPQRKTTAARPQKEG